MMDEEIIWVLLSTLRRIQTTEGAFVGNYFGLAVNARICGENKEQCE